MKIDDTVIQEYKIRKKLERIRATKSLANFIQYTKKDYQLKWFHEETCKWLDKLDRSEIKKLMIFMPAQHGKSEISSRRFPAFVLGRNPKTKIGLCSYSSDLASSFNREIQRIIDDDRYSEIFPKTRLNTRRVSADSRGNTLRNTHIFETVNFHGFVKTVGVGGPLTGTPIDLGIIDDPLKDRADANSAKTRENLWNWYNDVFRTRLHNDSKQLMLFTRWHEDDLAGRLLDPNNEHYDPKEAAEWTVLVFPALKEETPALPQQIDVNDPREIDEALWPEKHEAEKYYRRRDNNPIGFASMDQQRPTAQGGNKIKEEWFEIINESELPFNISDKVVNGWIDGAFTKETQNDESAVLSEVFHEGKLYILNCTGVRKELYEFLTFFKEYTALNYYSPRSKVNIEPKASGKDMKSMLRQQMFGAYNVIEVPNKTVALGKFNRVENAEPFIHAGKVVLVRGPWVKRFLEQVCSFPNGTHDDMVDVLCYAIAEYFVKSEKARGRTQIRE